MKDKGLYNDVFLSCLLQPDIDDEESDLEDGIYVEVCFKCPCLAPKYITKLSPLCSSTVEPFLPTVKVLRDISCLWYMFYSSVCYSLI